MRLYISIVNTVWNQWIAKMLYNPSFHELIILLLILNQWFTATSVFLQHVYCLKNLQQASENPEYFRNWVIFCTHNDTAAEHNTQILAQLSEQICKFHSVNTTDVNDDSDVHKLSVKFLASLNPAELPSAILELKIKAFVMLLQNMHLQIELCNDTYIIIICLHCLCIEASILSEQFADQRHILYRINLTTQEGDYLWIIIRKQFSVHLCFAITINKSQGQSLSVVDLNVQYQCFLHDQLYVTLSQITDIECLYLLENFNAQGKVQNVVYSEVFLRYNKSHID